ncbi:aminotransferase class 3 [Penicillium cf. viridicatum]|uniref:Aminotransferase class 3 n=1 Tax=Penicillium cf. viridicatum TaxID=2972119 RepID=A0A9W9IY68_9EURO|nr:aminotransferase class 3 [Penicillium cf. viridicatum]
MVTSVYPTEVPSLLNGDHPKTMVEGLAIKKNGITLNPTDETTFLFHRSFEYPLKLMERSDGHTITMGDGHQILDACGGAAVACIGQGNEEVIAAAVAQMREITYAHPLSYTTAAAEGLARCFLGENPWGLQKMFIVGSGSEANDVAMKLARHFFVEKGEPERVNFVARAQSFHGNTIGALSLGSHVARRRPYLPIILGNRVSHVSPAYAYQYMASGETEAGFVARLASELEDEFLRLGPHTVVAFVAETVVGATSGCVTAPAGYFIAVKAVCDKYGILLILDEIMCGAGRTGTTFAFEQEGVVPDIVTLGKGLGGGYAPIAAIIAHKRVCDGFRGGPSKAFNHGQTYQAHPLSCAIATSVQTIIQRDNLVDRCAHLGKLLGAMLKEKFADCEYVGEVRGRGLFWALEFVQSRQTKKPFMASVGFASKVHKESFQRGVSLYPGSGSVDGKVGDHLMFAPAYTSSEEEILHIVQTARDAYDQVVSELRLPTKPGALFQQYDDGSSSNLRPLKRYITTHDENGKGVFCEEKFESIIPIVPPNNIERAGLHVHYHTQGFPVDLSENKDLKRYFESTQNIPLANEGGSVCRVVDLGPGQSSPMHRTISLDYGVVLAGEVDLVLEDWDGPTKHLNVGDVVIQRGTIHGWRNPSKDHWSRMLYVLLPSEKLKINDTELDVELDGLVLPK